VMRCVDIRDPRLWVLVVVGCFFSFAALDWGTPNQERSLLVFGSESRIRGLSERMVQTREDLYAWTEESDVSRPAATRVAEKPPVESFPATFGGPSSEIKSGMVNSLRSYLLRSSDPDEQQTLSGLANMNLLRGDFDPNEYRYGGWYYYSLAGILGPAMLSGLVSLKPGVAAYFLEPEELATVFTLCRFLGAGSAFLAGLILYAWSVRRWERDVAVVAAVFLYCSPLLITYSRISKPNTYSMFLTLIALVVWDLMTRGIECKNVSSRRTAVLAGFLFGLGIGSFVVSGIVLIFAVVWAALRTRLDRRLTMITLFYVFPAVVVGFLITNPFVFLSWMEIGDLYFEHVSGAGWGYAIPRIEKLWSVVKDLPFALGYVATAAMTVGFVSGVIRRDSFSISCLVCFLLVSFLMGDPRFVIPLLPAFFIVAAKGSRVVLGSIRLRESRFSLAAVGMILVFGPAIQALGALAMDSHHRNKVGHWINENVPWRSSIGLSRQKPLIWHTPPMAFERYQIEVFYTLDAETLEQHRPEWFIYQYENSESLEEQRSWFPVSREHGYRLVKTFEPPFLLPGIRVSNRAYDFACQRVCIWKRTIPG